MRTAIAVCLMVLALSGAAQAHGRLVSSVPAAGGVADHPASILLRFNEKLEEAFSSFEVIDSHDAKLPLIPTVSGGGVILVAPLAAPLDPGAYTINWHVVTVSDGHKTQGTLTFTVN